MPELPEIETIKRVLEPQVQGQTIEKAVVRHPKVIVRPTADEFCERLAGQTIDHLERRGKFLTIALADQERIVLHLRMTGCLLLAPADLPEEKHTHVVLQLSGGSELRFSDMRRFGRFWLFQKNEDNTDSGMEKLGMEPFDPAFSAGYLEARLGRRKKTIKACLLEQEIIAGIGNIYSDEILFTAGIHPARPAASLTWEEWERLAAVIPERLSYFIEKNKVTPKEYLESKGENYRNAPFLQVYGHEGTPCPICGSKLCRMVVGGRSSVYCPVCQKEK